MTEKQFLEKVIEMLPQVNNLILEKAKKVFSSGAIEPSLYEDNYRLPKIFLCAVGKEISWQYDVHSKEYDKIVKNLGCFL